MEQVVTRIIIADDHPLVRGALRQAVSGAFSGAEILECGTLEDLSNAIEKNGDIDLVLLDLAMPGASGFSGLIFLRAQFPQTPVVVVSGNEDRTVIKRCIEFGAAGFIPKTTGIETMRVALRAVVNGDVWIPPDIDLSVAIDPEIADLHKRIASLTPQQMRVLMMVSEGLLNKQIAYHLNVSEATIKAHVSAILQKLNVDSRTQAVIIAAKIASTGVNPEV